jgi:hypothetical protein
VFLLLPLLASVLAGCLEPERLAFQEGQRSDATHDGQAWQVNLRGRVANLAPTPTRAITLQAGVGEDCLREPRGWPLQVEVGSLAAGASAPVRESFAHEGPRFPSPGLWWRLRWGEAQAQAAKGCLALAVG